VTDARENTATVTLEISGRPVEAPEGSTVLEAARIAGVEIPTLCHHPGLTPYGACRVCIVEVEQRGRARVDAACTRPVEDGMIVRTDTPELADYRRLTVELLLAQCPGSERLRELAQSLGIGESRFGSRDSDCILCGLCTRACQDQIGTSAISFVDRGLDRKVTTPFELQSDVCIGCGACAAVCPTGCIRVEDDGAVRRLKFLNTELELEACADCGAYFVPRRMLERLKGETELPEDLLSTCPSCRRKRMGAALREATR
jgi:bidirectional [NiFe] hydrogenase diaphorase subunit